MHTRTHAHTHTCTHTHAHTAVENRLIKDDNFFIQYLHYELYLQHIVLLRGLFTIIPYQLHCMRNHLIQNSTLLEKQSSDLKEESEQKFNQSERDLITARDIRNRTDIVQQRALDQLLTLESEYFVTVVLFSIS